MNALWRMDFFRVEGFLRCKPRIQGGQEYSPPWLGWEICWFLGFGFWCGELEIEGIS